MTAFVELGKRQALALTDEHLARDDPHTPTIGNVLRELNTLGVVTIGSQIGCHDKFEFDACYRYQSVRQLGQIQRAYLDCFCDSATAKTLLELMIGKTNLIVITQPASHTLTDPDNCHRQNTVPLTLWEMSDGTTKVNTDTLMTCWPIENAWLNLPDRISADDVELRDKLAPEAILVLIIDPDWGRETYLFDTVLDAVRNRVIV